MIPASAAFLSSWLGLPSAVCVLNSLISLTPISITVLFPMYALICSSFHRPQTATVEGRGPLNLVPQVW